jgi:ferritin-like metal-binding protein YciE
MMLAFLAFAEVNSTFPILFLENQAMTLSSLHDLLVDQLKDLHSAETQLVKALPRIIKQASTPSLKEAVAHHLEETRGHVERLDKIGKILDCKVTGKKCKAMEGLLEEGKEVLGAHGCECTIDAAIVAAAQRVEHYEMAAYGATRTLAELLGHQDVAALLQQTLDEEKAADKKLTDVVQQDIYPAAERGEEESRQDVSEYAGQGARST